MLALVCLKEAMRTRFDTADPSPGQSYSRIPPAPPPRALVRQVAPNDSVERFQKTLNPCDIVV
eukprot:18590-Eustigmatos_ZCMA.PRE.1